MTDRFRISRRHLGQLAVALLPSLAHAQSFDQGIGGTGVVGDPKDENSDQNIGGTGVVGTIRRFGSIYVNDLHILTPGSLKTSDDSMRFGSSLLKLGHVVGVVTSPQQGATVARSAVVMHEVVGPVQAIAGDRLTVLGQVVSLSAAIDKRRWAVGDPVAVSGLRQLDGTIVASLVERVSPGPLRLAGLLARRADGRFEIGGMPLRGVDQALVGQRVHLQGRQVGRVLSVAHLVSERAMLASLGPARWSIEGYVAREPAGLRFGSGLEVEAGSRVDAPSGLAIVEVALDARRRLVAEKVRAEPTTSSATQTGVDRKANDKGGAKHDGDHASPGHGQGPGGRGGRH